MIKEYEKELKLKHISKSMESDIFFKEDFVVKMPGINYEKIEVVRKA